MTSLALHGWPGPLVPVAAPTLVTNLSIFPPANAFCASLYSWSWLQVSTSLMLAGSRRRGLTWLPLASVLGLLVSRLPLPPAPGAPARLFTRGVSPSGWNRWPEVLAAFGYVPK